MHFIFQNVFARTAFCAVLSPAAVLLTDRFAMPAANRAEWRCDQHLGARLCDIIARIPAVALIFAISWRPLYALAGTFSFFTIFTGISRAKFSFIREPLIFSDIALVVDVFKHKEIFYATRLNVIFWILALGYVFGASTLFMLFEPDTLPTHHQMLLIAVMIALPLVPGLLLFNLPYRKRWSHLATRLFSTDDIRTITVRLGTFTAVMSHFLMWLGRTRQVPKPVIEARPATLIETFPEQAAGSGKAKPLVVVWQSESFMDLRHAGMTSLSLPNLDRLRQRAVDWGRLLSVFEGGYTLRTEFSVLTGLSPQDIGVDAYHPYLRAEAYGAVAWPSFFRHAGWSTHFLHPYDRRFFSRHRALPRLGFESLTMLDGFDHDSERDGRYVSDMALSRRVLSVSGANQDQAQFVFAASMENHGPWLPGRCGGRQTPLDIYSGILERSDAALGHLVEALDRISRPVWLIFYGDHAPLLKSFANPFPDPRTDYLIAPLGTAGLCQPYPAHSNEKAPWNLIGDMVARLRLDGTRSAAAAGIDLHRSVGAGGKLGMGIRACKGIAARTFLFLQGPSSPLFARIADNLEAHGHRCLRVNFCLGDWMFWRHEGARNFRGRVQEWSETIAESSGMDLCRVPFRTQSSCERSQFGSRLQPTIAIF